MEKKVDITEPVSLAAWKKLRRGRGYRSFHGSLKAYMDGLGNNLAEAYRNAWEIYLCQLVQECMDVDEKSCGAPWHVPRAFGLMEWDVSLVDRFMSDYVEGGGNYYLVYAMNSEDTPPFLTEVCEQFVEWDSDSTHKMIDDAIERGKRLDSADRKSHSTKPEEPKGRKNMDARSSKGGK